MKDRTDLPDAPSPDRLRECWSRVNEALLRELDRVVPDGADVVYLDYPVYRNVGDILIYLGTENWLAARPGRVLGRWHLDNFRFPRLPEDVVLLCQGGGNFGDLYRHQSFRERVVERYPRHRVVVLPQSMCFTSPAAVEASAAAFPKHPDLHFLWREHRSLGIARESFAGADHALAPDMASRLFPLSETLGIECGEGAAGDALYLLRDDQETASSLTVPDIGPGWRGDWADLARGHQALMRAWQIVAFGIGRIIPAAAFERRWRKVALGAIRWCAPRLKGSRAVVTSRLHGHILSCLLGVPNLVLDNRFGKCSGYFEAWHREFGFTRLG